MEMMLFLAKIPECSGCLVVGGGAGAATSLLRPPRPQPQTAPFGVVDPNGSTYQTAEFTTGPFLVRVCLPGNRWSHFVSAAVDPAQV